MKVILFFNKWKWLFLLSVPFILIFTITGLHFPLLWDEGKYHIPGILVMRDSFPFFNIEQYNSATTPLFHLFYGTIFKLFGSKIIIVRVINSFLSFFTLIIFYKILKKKMQIFLLRKLSFFYSIPIFLFSLFFL